MEIRPTPWPPKDQPAFVVLVSLLLVSLIMLFGFRAWNAAREHKFIGVPIERNEITVSGEGKVVVVPDVAEIDLGTTIERLTVVAAQSENTKVMNGVVAKLKELGVGEKDIQTTSYNIYPLYDYPPDGRQRLRGYQVAQNVHVKIRELGKAGDIIGAAGQLGANQVGNITFNVAEPEAVRQEARVKALQNAKDKAEALSQVVGVKLRRVVKFEEEVGGSPPVYQAFSKDAAGIGGTAPSPSVQPGTNEVVVTATVTYEIE